MNYRLLGFFSCFARRTSLMSSLFDTTRNFSNQELSQDLMWGPDTADLMAGNNGQQQYRNIEIFQDPHTKCFLLVQAYLEHAKLPISDYVNDTKSVVENIPRLLAAMAYIAAEEKSFCRIF